MLMDQMHVLDTLKAAKVSLADDIAIARHAYQQSSGAGKQQQHWDEDTDFDGLLEFLEDPWACVKQMHSCIKQVNYQHRVVARLVQYICDSLVEKVRSNTSAPLIWAMTGSVCSSFCPWVLATCKQLEHFVCMVREEVTLGIARLLASQTGW